MRPKVLVIVQVEFQFPLMELLHKVDPELVSLIVYAGPVATEECQVSESLRGYLHGIIAALDAT